MPTTSYVSSSAGEGGTRPQRFTADEPVAPQGPEGSPVVIDLGIGHLVCTVSAKADVACPECVRLRWIRSRPTPEREALLAGAHITGPRAAPNPWAEAMLASVTRCRLAPGAVVHLNPSALTVTTHRVAASSDCPASHHRTRRASAAPGSLGGTVIGRSHALGDLHLPENELVGDCVGVLAPHIRETWFNPVAVCATGTLRERSIFSRVLTFGMGGHGSSRKASRRLSLLEGLERHSGLRKRHDGPVRVARFQDIADTALDPAVFGCYPPEHFAPGRNRMGHVPWSQDLEISWVPGLEVTTGCTVWVPQQMAYYLARAGTTRFIQDTSNGCAVGVTLAEAFLGGALEVIERDAFLVHWYGRRAMPRISARARDLPLRARVMCARLDAAGFDIHLFDSRVDLRIPSVIALAVRRGGGPGGFALGAGAALDPGDAVQAAVREAACNAPLMAATYESDPQRAHSLWEKPELVDTLEHHSLMYSVPGAVSRLGFWLDGGCEAVPATERFSDWLGCEPFAHRGSLGDAGVLLAEFRRHDLSPVLVDQTAEELERLGLRACRVFIPGLLPLDFGHHNERALSLGRSRVLLEDDAPVNAFPHPLS